MREIKINAMRKMLRYLTYSSEPKHPSEYLKEISPDEIVLEESTACHSDNPYGMIADLLPLLKPDANQIPGRGVKSSKGLNDVTKKAVLKALKVQNHYGADHHEIYRGNNKNFVITEHERGIGLGHTVRVFGAHINPDIVDVENLKSAFARKLTISANVQAELHIAFGAKADPLIQAITQASELRPNLAELADSKLSEKFQCKASAIREKISEGIASCGFSDDDFCRNAATLVMQSMSLRVRG